MPHAELDGGKRCAAAYKQCAHAFGGIKLMPCQRQQVCPQHIHIHRDFAYRLSGIHMYDSTCRMGKVSQCANGLDAVDFVVGEHH